MASHRIDLKRFLFCHTNLFQPKALKRCVDFTGTMLSSCENPATPSPTTGEGHSAGMIETDVRVLWQGRRWWRTFGLVPELLLLLVFLGLEPGRRGARHDGVHVDGALRGHVAARALLPRTQQVRLRRLHRLDCNGDGARSVLMIHPASVNSCPTICVFCFVKIRLSVRTHLVVQHQLHRVLRVDPNECNLGIRNSSNAPCDI